MNKFFTKSIIALAATVMTAGFTSCDDDESVDLSINEKNEVEFKAISKQFVDHTVIPTYKKLAESSKTLVERLNDYKEEKTEENLKAATEAFINSRTWWEKSEAFLFGPATTYGIDPHIDSWPLDVKGLKDELANKNHIKQMDSEDGDIFAGAKLGAELLGFHGIEYILFRNGEIRKDITDDEIIYATAVAGDLRNNCYRLWISWAGEDNVPKYITEKMEELEWEYTLAEDGETSFKDNIMNSGNAGSTFKTWATAMQQIVDGQITIADEVGSAKIGEPYNATPGEGDEEKIESPYSQRSIIDFQDNIISVKNSYMGGIEGERDESLSLHNYVKKNNPELDKMVLEGIKKSFEAINSMEAPFVDNIHSESAKKAIEATTALTKTLEELKDYMGR